MAPDHKYYVYMEQLEAEIDNGFFFEHELGEYDMIEGVYKCLYSLFHSQYLTYFRADSYSTHDTK